VAWSGLEVTGEDILVDGWWTLGLLCTDNEPARDVRACLSADVGRRRAP
jgi:hypothetical protein